MSVTIEEESPFWLDEYAHVPIGFNVTEVFSDQAVAALLDGRPAAPSAIAEPYRKDYDRSAEDHPTRWPTRFDVSRWIIFAAYDGERRVAGAVLIVDDSAIDLLEGCVECGLLWDIRVAPGARGHGVGSALLRAVEQRAIERGARALRVETQQVNVPACRFYARNGFRLEQARRGVYAHLPNEIQLLWRKPLAK